MTFKKIVFGLTLAAITSTTALAGDTATPEAKPMKTALKDMIQDLKLDVDMLTDATLKIKFMVNENKELIVLGTNDEAIDGYIKNSLNYKTLDTSDAKPYEVYIVPVRVVAAK